MPSPFLMIQSRLKIVGSMLTRESFGQYEGKGISYMDLLFIILLFVMLIFVGYAKVQQGVVRTPGAISMTDDEE